MTIILSNDDRERLVSEAACYDANIYEDYSGRFMYNDHCMGIYGNITDGEANQILRNALPDLFADIAVCACSDSLGLGTIYYYPNVKFDEDEFYEDD